jgi:hypothetical protein
MGNDKNDVNGNKPQDDTMPFHNSSHFNPFSRALENVSVGRLAREITCNLS